MRVYWAILLGGVGIVLSGGAATACIVAVSTNLNDVEFADVVVTGQIRNYQIVEDAQAREDRKRMFENTPALREILGEGGGHLSDYARFEIEVDEVLRGVVNGPVIAIWDNSTFGEPETMPSGPFLIALRRSTSATPPLRGPSATFLPNPEPNSWSVLQAPCAGPFIFETTSADAAAVRRILASMSR